MITYDSFVTESAHFSGTSPLVTASDWVTSTT